MLPTSEKVQYSVGRVEHTRIQPHRQETKQPISMYITTVLYFMVSSVHKRLSRIGWMSWVTYELEQLLTVWNWSERSLCVVAGVCLYLILSFRWFCPVSILHVPSTQAERVKDYVMTVNVTHVTFSKSIHLLYVLISSFMTLLKPNAEKYGPLPFVMNWTCTFEWKSS